MRRSARTNRGARRRLLPLAAVATLATCAAALTACADDAYLPRVICHNSNCVEPTSPEEDDTLEALEASLLLEDEAGFPLIDGIEIDTFWYGAQQRCLFAHDLLAPKRSVDATRAVARLNAHLAERHVAGRPLTRRARYGGDDRFSVFIELKGHVGELKSEVHSPDERRRHVACAVGLGEALADGAAAHGYALEIAYTSFDPALLVDLRHDAAFDELEAGPARVRIGILQGIPRPLDGQTRALDEFPHEIGADFVSAHPHWVRSPDRHAYASRDLELGYWMFALVPKTFDAIRRDRPSYITTSEARAVDAWLK